MGRGPFPRWHLKRNSNFPPYLPEGLLTTLRKLKKLPNILLRSERNAGGSRHNSRTATVLLFILRGGPFPLFIGEGIPALLSHQEEAVST